MRTSLYASPGYLAALPALRAPQDLETVNALVLAGRGADREWILAHGREKTSLVPQGNVEVDDMGALISLVAAGAGVALLPTPLVAEAVATHRLVEALPGWRGPDAPVFAVYLSRRMPHRLRLLLEHVRAWVREQEAGLGNLA
jgi:DNA-binding transcriptional LysR family regulator